MIFCIPNVSNLQMTLLVATHSNYPRIGDRPDQQKLRQAFEKFDRRDISEESLREAIGAATGEVIAEQERAGADLVTDGQIRWPDPVSHWVKSFKGIKLAGLFRFMDTNTYFRIPRIDGALERKDFRLRENFLLAVERAGKPLKAVLPGPVTLALLCERGPYFSTMEDFIGELSTRLAEEVGLLAEAGAKIVQIDEPMVLRRPEFFPLLSQALGEMRKKKGGSRIFLATYFADAAPFYPRLQDLPVEGLVLDCVEGPGILQRACQGSDKTLGLGILDGRSTRLEDPADLSRPLKRVLQSLKTEETYLTTSCGLEYLPRAKAFEKLSLLSRLKEMMG